MHRTMIHDIEQHLSLHRFVRRHGSAGLEPQGINPYTVRVMEEIGYDLSDQDSKDVTKYLGKEHFGYLITVCAHAEEHCPKTFLGVSERIHWPVEDPAAAKGSDEEIMQAFRTARDDLDARVQAWLKELDTRPQEEA